MPSYRRLPSGKWQVAVRTPEGKRIYHTHPLKGACKAWAAEQEVKVARGTYQDPALAKSTVAAWHAQWNAARVVQPITQAKNDSHWRNHVAPKWASWQLRSVTTLDVQAWVREMQLAGTGAHTIEGAVNLLSSMLKAAVVNGVLPANPCAGVKTPPTNAGRLRWFTRAEASLILDQLTGSDRLLVDLSLHTGLRWGEAAGLHGEDVDWGNERLTVVNVLTRKGIREYPKSQKSRRVVPVPERIVGELIQYGIAGPLFRAPAGGLLDDNHWRRRVWAPALERAGVEYAPPHTLRHTAASWLVQAGVDLYRVQALLGHESFATTMKYAHLAPDSDSAIRDAWAQSPSGRKPAERMRPAAAS